MLRAIRRFALLNRIVRSILVAGEMICVKLSGKWKVAGVVSIEVGQLKAKFYSNCDDPIVDSLYYKRPYEEQSDLLFFVQLAKRSSYILDIGAFTGLYSIFSAVVNPLAIVYSFEPNASNYKRLQRNKRINALDNIRILPYAVGAVDSTIKFFSPSGDVLSDTSSVNLEFSQLTYSGKLEWEASQIQQIAIDSFREQEMIRRVDLIKIDVESNEICVFDGLLKTIERDRPIILCEIFLDNERTHYFNSFVLNHDYSLYLVLKEGIIRLDNGISANRDGLNYLFAPFKTNQIFTSFREIENIADLFMKRKKI